MNDSSLVTKINLTSFRTLVPLRNIPDRILLTYLRPTFLRLSKIDGYIFSIERALFGQLWSGGIFSCVVDDIKTLITAHDRGSIPDFELVRIGSNWFKPVREVVHSGSVWFQWRSGSSGIWK